MKIIIVAILFCLPVFAGDAALAEALAATGVAYVSKGNVVAARDHFYRALVHDESCGTALFELGRLADKDGDRTLAAIFYARAIPGLADASRAIAEARIKTLNPHAAKLTAAIDDYARGLEGLVKSHPDKHVLDEAVQRSVDLNMSRILPSSRMPKLKLPAARVSFKEDMGYVVTEFKDGVASHVGEPRSFKSVPTELSGLQYTKLVPYKASSVTVSFDTAGSLYILAAQWSGSTGEAEKLLAIGAEETLFPELNDGIKYKIWKLSKPAGATVVLANHALIATTLKKDK